MKRAMIFLLALASFSMVSCGSKSENDMCQYEGHEIIEYITRESECGCGKAYYLHLKNGNKFQEVRVNPAVYKYYKKERPEEGYYRIQCVKEVELKED